MSNHGSWGLIASLWLFAGCAGAGTTRLSPSNDLITKTDLATLQNLSAYQAIARLRPEFLRSRGPSSITLASNAGPSVFVDETYVGGIGVLRDIPVGEVERIKYVAAWDATTVYGPGHVNGVIEVTTRRGPLRRRG